MTRVAIIGAGLSGRLLALNLLRQASRGVSIRLIDRGDARYMGPAYSDEADYLLLNVPAERMGAFSEDPEHFLKWVHGRGIPAGRFDFLPRRLYRDYILDLLGGAAARTNGPLFEQVSGEVTDIETARDGITIHVSAESVTADKAVLALGNFPPRHPPIEDRAALASSRYEPNPWRPRLLEAVTSNDTVFLIGTGQTTVDLAIALHKRGHTGRIVAISRHGFLPLAHRRFESYSSFIDEIRESSRIREVFRIVRTHVDRAKAIGMDERAVIDSLRPDTQALWLGMPSDEKLRFLRHLFRYWEIVRSRIPPESEVVINSMRGSGQLDVVAGRVCHLVEMDRTMEVHYAPRGEATDHIVTAALVINCIGPESDYRRIEHPLVRNLLMRGLIRPGPAFLGIDARPNGAIVGRDGAVSDVLYTLGSTMKGVLWEVIAVPEIRVQAEGLAHTLVGAT